MDSNNLIFNSKIDSYLEDICFGILLEYFSDDNYEKVYVKNVVLAGSEILFFVNIDGTESIIRICM